MNRFIAVIKAVVCISLLMPAATAQKPTPSPVLQALDEELKRAFDLLRQKGDPAPYFIECLEYWTWCGFLRCCRRHQEAEAHKRPYDCDEPLHKLSPSAVAAFYTQKAAYETDYTKVG